MENTYLNYGTIKVNLKALIEAKQINRTALSYRTEISRPQINRLYHGEATGAKFSTLARLCGVLDCSVGDLLEYVPPDCGRQDGTPDKL